MLCAPQPRTSTQNTCGVVRVPLLYVHASHMCCRAHAIAQVLLCARRCCTSTQDMCCRAHAVAHALLCTCRCCTPTQDMCCCGHAVTVRPRKTCVVVRMPLHMCCRAHAVAHVLSCACRCTCVVVRMPLHMCCCAHGGHVALQHAVCCVRCADLQWLLRNPLMPDQSLMLSRKSRPVTYPPAQSPRTAPRLNIKEPSPGAQL